MPFVSKAQQRFMWAKHPRMAKEWQAKTPEGAHLPEHVKHSALIIKWVMNGLEKRAAAAQPMPAPAPIMAPKPASMAPMPVAAPKPAPMTPADSTRVAQSKMTLTQRFDENMPWAIKAKLNSGAKNITGQKFGPTIDEMTKRWNTAKQMAGDTTLAPQRRQYASGMATRIGNLNSAADSLSYMKPTFFGASASMAGLPAPSTDSAFVSKAIPVRDSLKTIWPQSSAMMDSARVWGRK